MCPIRSRRRQRGLTLMELMIGVMLGLVVMLAAGAVFLGVNKSFRQGAHKVTSGSETTLLSTVISRQVRVASGYMIYNSGDRTVATNTGDGLALLDAGGNVIYRYEWDSGNKALVDSTGAQICAMNLQSLRFSADPVSPRTVRYAYRTIDEASDLVDIESAVTLRN